MAIGLGLGIHHQNMVDWECVYCIGATYQGGIIFWLNGSGGGLIAGQRPSSKPSEISS